MPCNKIIIINVEMVKLKEPFYDIEMSKKSIMDIYVLNSVSFYA